MLLPAPESTEYTIHLPELPAAALDQHEEYFELEQGGERRRIRLHDYEEIFQVPGLYEQVYAESLQCDSPRIVVDLLHDALRDGGHEPGALQVLDFAAGNGMVGEELARVDAGAIVGIDLLEAAKEAAERDRPDVYDAYHAVDLTDLSDSEQRELSRHDFNALTCVAALGFGDVPASAFGAAFDLVEDGGWVAFNIRDRLLSDADGSEFAHVLATALSDGTIDERARVTYQHRVNVGGDPLNYLAVVGRKQGELSVAA